MKTDWDKAYEEIMRCAAEQAPTDVPVGITVAPNEDQTTTGFFPWEYSRYQSTTTSGSGIVVAGDINK